MDITVRIPLPFRSFTEGKGEVKVKARDIAECVQCLETEYPGLREMLRDSKGKLNRFINLYVNGRNIRFLRKLATFLKPNDEVSIIPAIAGGRFNIDRSLFKLSPQSVLKGL